MEQATKLTGPGRLRRLLTAFTDTADPLLAISGSCELYFANTPAQRLLRVGAEQLPIPLAEALADPALAEGIARLVGQDTAPNDKLRSPTLMWELDNMSCQVEVQRAGHDFLVWATPLDPTAPLHERLNNDHMRRFWAAALAGVGTWTWDLSENCLRSDAIFGQLTGIAGNDALLVDDLFEKVHDDDKTSVRAAIDRAVSSSHEEDVELDTQFRFRSHDGTEKWLAMRGGVIRDTDGKAIMLSGVHFDVTERKRAEQALRQAKEALQEASRAKDSFLAKVSHEIRTPLTTMLGYAELMTRRVTNEQDRQDLSEILNSGQYLQRLVDDLLDLSRVIAGKVSVSPEPVNLRHLAHELLSTMNMRAAEKALGFSLNIGPGVPLDTLSDPVRVRQIMTNLIGNAVKFTDQGEVAVRIYATEDSGTEFVAFEVKDTGPGIAKDKLALLFEPFSQTRNSDASLHGGLGLGLAISLRLAEVVGGRIDVASAPGQGSTFTFLLPVVPVNTDSEAHVPDPLTDTAAPAHDVEISGRILAADDVQPILSLLENYLSTAGAEVVTAGNGVEALDQLQRAADLGRPFDLALLDIHMPHLDGMETLKRLRDAGHQLPVIALSASAMKDERVLCEERGFDAFVAKPFSAQQLLSAVAGLLRKPANHRARELDGRATQTVLVVEDNEALAELTGRQLASLGFRVETAHTGAAALDRAKALTPNVMLVDLTLPDMNGIDLCRSLRDDPIGNDCQLIAYTGREDPQARNEALNAGFDDLLLKPASLGDFAALLVANSNDRA